MSRDRRQKRDLHAFNEDGMVLCNPRDKEAAHRAQMEGIATDDRAAVTCRKCRKLLFECERQPLDGQARPDHGARARDPRNASRREGD
jgi:hypothetical protein